MMKAINLTSAVACFSILSAALMACSDPETPPPASLDGPKKMVAVRYCAVGDGIAPRLRVAVERCEAGEFDGEQRAIAEYLYLTNESGNSVAVASYNSRPPELIDVDPATPGVTHIGVGEGPGEIAASRDGNFIFVFNHLSHDISVIAESLRTEIARIPVGESATAMVAAPDRDALWILGADTGALHEVSWTATCDGEPDYYDNCRPEFEATVDALYPFPEGSAPRFMVPGAQANTVLVAFAGLGQLSEVLLSGDSDVEGESVTCVDGSAAPCLNRVFGLTFGCGDGIDNDGDGLIDGADPQCLSARGSEDGTGLSRDPVTDCSDGIDNDGDGLIDGADGSCTSHLDRSETGAIVMPACNDGLDNDGDGLADDEDPECQLPDGAFAMTHRSEAVSPECADGEDNDGDGLADDEDPDCIDPLWNREHQTPECSDGQDNDADGLTDDLDPDCASPFGSESLGECADGLDNDGDGVADLNDPGCINPRSDNELSGAQVCNDGIDNDGDGLTDYPDDPGCYGTGGNLEAPVNAHQFGPIAVDPGGQFAYVIDRTVSQLIVVDLVTGVTLDANANRRFDSRIGIPVSRLPTSVTAQRVEVPIATDGDRRIARTIIQANVATTSGVVHFVEAAELWQAFDGTEVTHEIQNSLLRLTDRDGDSSSVSNVGCTISDELEARVPGDDTTGRVQCDSTGVPQLTTFESPITPPAGTAPLTVSVLPVVRTRNQLTFNDANEVEEVVRVDADGYRLTAEQWAVVYEGVLTERTDIVVDQDDDSLLRSQGGNLCTAGVEPGDIVTITSTPTPVPGTDVDCDPYVGVDLTYRVESVRARLIQLALIPDAMIADLNRPAEALPLVQAFPKRACFSAGMGMQARALDQWVVLGENSGFIHDTTSASDICVPETGDQNLSGRATAGTPFKNPFFEFTIDAPIEPPRDFQLSFSTNDRFDSVRLASGAASTDLMDYTSQRGRYMTIIDSGTNVVRVYDMSRSNTPLITVFF